MTASAPHRIEIVPWGFWKAKSGFTESRNQNSIFFGGGYLRQNGAASANDGDWVEWEVLLDGGTWALDVIYLKNNTAGIMDFSLGGASVGTIDGYNATSLNNQVTTLSGFVVSAFGYETLRVTINGKNTSSSDYLMHLNLLVLRRTGD